MNDITNALYLVAAAVVVVGLVYLFFTPKGKQFEASMQAEWAKIHAKLDALHIKQDATHAAALAPVTVAVVPAGFSPAPPAGVPEPVPQPAQPPAAAVPVALPPGGNTTDATAPGFVMPAQPAPAPVEPAAPVLNTSADTLDFNVVGGGVPIDLTGPKTIVNCPDHVVVWVAQASGQSGAHNSYTVTVNNAPTFMPNVQSQYVSSNYGLDVRGPNVTVSVDSPGLQMEIRAA